MAGSGSRIAQMLRRAAERAARRYARKALHNALGKLGQQGGGPQARQRGERPFHTPGAPGRSGYPGDFRGRPTITYAPNRNGLPDPGEVVWTWVPYEEDYSRGKDRPVLLIGTDGDWLLGLQLTSKDHDQDAGREARAGRYWMDIGAGEWDEQGRESEVRLNRIIRIDPDGVRRTAAKLDRHIFDRVADGVRQHA